MERSGTSSGGAAIGVWSQSRRSRDEPGIDRPFVLMKCLLSESLSNDMEESAASDTSTCHQRVKDQSEREDGGVRRSTEAVQP